MLEIALIFTSTLVLFAYAENTPIYSDPYSPIFTNQDVYTWTDKVEITILAPSWNANRYGVDSIGADEGHFIKISTSEHSLEPYKLTETGANTGIFTGEVILTGFDHDVDGDGSSDTNPRTMGTGPTSGFLEAKRDEGITISFEFADGVVLTHSALIKWNIGEVFFDEPSYFVGETAKIQVRDPDMNLNPEGIDQIELEVSSSSDSAGILVDALETTEDSGVFEASILFTQTQTSSGNRLFALPGDSLNTNYDDYTLPKPYSILDNLEVKSQSKFNSDVPLLERISISNNYLSDSSGNFIQDPTINNQIQVVGTVQNNQSFHQPFVFIMQIKRNDGSTESVSWIVGELAPDQKLDLAQSWNPTVPGNYKVETFVWKSFVEPIPLTPIFEKSYFIQ